MQIIPVALNTDHTVAEFQENIRAGILRPKVQELVEHGASKALDDHSPLFVDERVQIIPVGLNTDSMVAENILVGTRPKEQDLVEHGASRDRNKAVDDHAPLLVDEPVVDLKKDVGDELKLQNVYRKILSLVESEPEPERSVEPESGPGRSVPCGCIRGLHSWLFVNLMSGVRKIPKPMKYVLAVMSLSWFAWFPFFLYDTDWMGREIYGGDPMGSRSEADAYQRGVEKGAFGLLLNSVVSALRYVPAPIPNKYCT